MYLKLPLEFRVSVPWLGPLTSTALCAPPLSLPEYARRRDEERRALGGRVVVVVGDRSAAAATAATGDGERAADISDRVVRACRTAGGDRIRPGRARGRRRRRDGRRRRQGVRGVAVDESAYR